MQAKYFDPDGTDRIVEYEDPISAQDPDEPQDDEAEAYAAIDRASWLIAAVGIIVLVVAVWIS